MCFDMKVALLTDADVFAGTERHLLDLARALQDADSECQPIIFCPAPSPLSERAQQFGIATVAVPANRGKLFDAKLLRTLRRNLRSARVDIIHAHNGRTLLHAVLAQRLAQRGCVVFTQHFLEPAHASHGGLKAKVFTAAHRWVNSHVKHFLAVSNAAREGMVERGNATGEKVAVVHHALYNPDQSTLAPQEQVRAKFGVPVNAPLVVAVARLEKE